MSVPSPSIRDRNRPGFTLVEVMIVIAIIGVLAAIAQPAFQKYRRHAMTRTCWKNQKTISGAMTQYNLEKNTSRNDLPEFLVTLQQDGYIQTLPDDPGIGPGTYTNYLYTARAFGVTCRKHGTLE